MTTENLPLFSPPSAAARLLGLPVHQLRDWRLSGRLIQGVHYQKHGATHIFVNALVADGMVHGFESPKHLEACDRWLNNLPSGQLKSEST